MLQVSGPSGDWSAELKSSRGCRCSRTELPPKENVRCLVTVCQKNRAASRRPGSPPTSPSRWYPTTFGDLGVGVHPVEDVAVLAQRAEQGPVEEPPCQGGVAVRAGDVGEVRQHLAHPAELRAEHGFVGFVVHPRRHLVPPVGQPSDGGQGQVRTGVPVGVQQAGEELVQVVPRHPGTTELEGVRLHLPRGHPLPQPNAVGDAPDVAGAQGVLALDDALNQTFDHGSWPGIVRHRAHESGTRQRVPDGVAVETRVLPVAVGLGNRRQAGLAPQGREEPVGVEGQQVVQGGGLRVQERAGEKAYRAAGE